MTSSRSVTRTRTPRLTWRRYALRLFFRFFTPTRSTAFMASRVATGSYYVKSSMSVGTGGWLFFLTTCVRLSFSAFYEFIEWGTAVATGSKADGFLETQGDPEDTRWDVLCAVIGAVTSQVLLARAHVRLSRDGPGPQGGWSCLACATAGSQGSSPSTPRPTGSRGSSLALRHRSAGSGGWRWRRHRRHFDVFLLGGRSRGPGAASGENENADQADGEKGFHDFLPVIAGRPRLSVRFDSKDGRSEEGSLWGFLGVSWSFSDQAMRPRRLSLARS